MTWPRALRAGALTVAAGVALAAVFRGCAGPAPEVLVATVDPSPAGPIARATVANRGGEGQVVVEFRVRERRTGRVIFAEGQGQARRGEVLEILARERLPPGDYEVEAEAQYPPQ